MGKLLLVDDDETVCQNVKLWLEQDKHMVDLAKSVESAKDFMRVIGYDLLILDWNLPDASGLELLKQLRQSGNSVPVLMLTGHGDMEHKVIGFETGADDYLAKPFHEKELSLRVKALLKRPASDLGILLRYGDLEVDIKNFKVTRNGKAIRLSPIEFNLLTTFIRHPNTVMSADALIERVWPTDSEASPDVVRKYVQRLRDKIDTGDGQSLIRTVHGVGYAWEAK
ncbi:MAG: response regulator transcription factor [Candidatus Obscuribacterales bacterium]|nr:response regulator transcription factor [Candidatus Obscuribacterales bacterium]